MGVVQAGHQDAVRLDLMDKFGENFLNVVQVPVMVQMVPVDIGDHGDMGIEDQEGAVAFIGFGDKIISLAQDSITSQSIHHAAHHDGRGQAALFQNRGDHGGGSSFTVGAGNGDLSFPGHKGSQHLGPGENRQAGCLGGLQFRVVETDGRRDNNNFRSRQHYPGHGLEKILRLNPAAFRSRHWPPDRNR